MPASSSRDTSAVGPVAPPVVALAVSAAATLGVSAMLAYGVDLTEGRPWHAVMRPFGDPQVFWATAVASLPLTGLLGTGFGRTPQRRWIGLIGLLLASWWTLATHGDWPTIRLDSLKLDYVAELLPPALFLLPALSRLSWIVLWQVPAWALWGPAVWPWSASHDAHQSRPAVAVVWPWLVAVAVPWIFALHRADSIHRSVARLTAQQRTWEAWLLAGRWHDLDPRNPSAAEAHRLLTRTLSEITLRTQSPLNNQAAASDLLQRAVDLARLNQLDEAQALVDQLELEICPPLSASSSGDAEPRRGNRAPGAAVDNPLCGELHRVQADLAARRGRWTEAAERTEQALMSLRRRSERDADQRWMAQKVLLVDAAADYWRRARRYDRALNVIESARAAAPDRPEYVVLLGDHFRSGGQAWRAALAYEWATKSVSFANGLTEITANADTRPAELDAEWSARAERGLAELRRTTPACLWVMRRP